MNVGTVALYCPMPVIVLVTVSDEVHCVNRHWTAALGPIEGNEPSLTAGVAVFQVEVPLKNNTESGSILHLVEHTILQNNNPKNKRIIAFI